mgnify:CR=1 FL=1
MVAHGDDFTVLGHDKDLDWFRQYMPKRHEVKFRGRLGPVSKDDKAIIILNRLVQWTEQGIEYEADQRHAEIIIADAGQGIKSGDRATPGIRDTSNEVETALSVAQTTQYRSTVARATHLLQYRSDILYAAKELSRSQCNPTTRDVE